MASDDAKAVVKSYLKAFNDRDHEALEEYLAADAVEHGVHEKLIGADEIIEYLDAHFQAFPDYAGSTQQMIAEDDMVAVRYSASGTHTGEYKNVEPTGHDAIWSGIAMYRVEDGQVAEVWVEEDRLELLEQLELVSESQPAHLRL